MVVVVVVKTKRSEASALVSLGLYKFVYYITITTPYSVEYTNSYVKLANTFNTFVIS